MKSKEISSDTLSESSKVSDQDRSVDTDKKNSDRNHGTGFISKKCTVLWYDKISHVLDVEFDGYGIRISDVRDFKGCIGSIIDIKYKGEIGNSNFQFKM